MLRFWQDFGVSVLLAYVMYILIEAPCGVLETLLLPNRRPASKPTDEPLLEVAPEALETPEEVEKQTGPFNPKKIERQISYMVMPDLSLGNTCP